MDLTWFVQPPNGDYTQWFPHKINLDETCFIHSITRSLEAQLGMQVDWVGWHCIDCRPLMCTIWFNYQLDLELLRSLIVFILLLLLFSWSAWPWFIDLSIPLTRPFIWILLKTAANYQLTFCGWLGGKTRTRVTSRCFFIMTNIFSVTHAMHWNLPDCRLIWPKRYNFIWPLFDWPDLIRCNSRLDD